MSSITPPTDIITPPANLDLAGVRAKLAESSGRDYWRSIDELADTEEFREYVKHEFPRDVELWMEDISRRDFLKLMGAGMALAFFSGCRKPLEKIIPYNEAPENVIPGKALFFASALPFQGYARGVLVENHMGRPLKIEGNPEHPDSLGATDAFMQSAVLTFYDPDRSQIVTRNGTISTWDSFFGEFERLLNDQKAKNGSGLRILTETVTSPTLGAKIQQFLKKFPSAQWHQYEPVTRDSVREGARLAYGQVVETHYRLEQAEVILSLDADFFSKMPGSLNYARAFADKRRVSDTNTEMNRLYALEPTPTITGTMADHRMPLSAAGVTAAAHQLAHELNLPAGSASGELSSAQIEWLRAAARDLQAHRGKSVVIAGEGQPAVVHALAHAMNQSLGNVGRTVVYTASAEVQPVDQQASLRQLTQDMQAGKVEGLLILGGNPVYDAPADLEFSAGLSRVGFRARLGLYEDETSALCEWHLPEAHPLEAWGDLRAYNGAVSIIQPQVAPLYGGKTAGEVLSAVIDDIPQTGHDLVREYWLARAGVIDFESFWRKTLNDGIMAGSAFDAKGVSLRSFSPTYAKPSAGIEVVFMPDASTWDGRYANNGWLQELPRPLTKMVWDNAALIAPALAERLHLKDGDLITLNSQNRSFSTPVMVLPGQAPNTVTLTLGYGRTRAGRVGNGTGFNTYMLRTSGTMSSASNVDLKVSGGHYKLATTQTHYQMEGRDLIRVATIEEYRHNPAGKHEAAAHGEESASLHDYTRPPVSDEYAWGMGIDLNMCIGCNACVIACQSENNIPVVGKEQVAKGREMHWLRVDKYHTGDLDNPETYNQPVPCMHCETAPCEVVCPVGATTHSDEGLNQMVYNRCIGTRYCSNNCPYKVRRFNFLNFTDSVEGPLKLLQNPDVTVRSRGVMEKCTYCVQRIEEKKIDAKKEGRLVLDGEIVPACAQACPTRTIQFGNMKDPKSKVSQMKAQPRNYGLLADLGTKPRTTYQTRLRNPNPEIKEG